MKLLWLCNMRPGKVQKDINGQLGDGLWIDNVLDGLMQKDSLSIFLFCLASMEHKGLLSDKCGYETFTAGPPHVYMPELEEKFRKQLLDFNPDVIHIWGTEYAHTLAMINAAEKADMLDRVVVSIQGLCSVIARHYAEGIPLFVQRSTTFRDLLRWDNIHQQKMKFVRRGEFEVKAIEKTHNLIGRTCWDKACTEKINANACYHFCNETLRPPFYEGEWSYISCKKHRIFASSCFYSVKGFHYLLEAFADVLKEYPDAVLSVPGVNYMDSDLESMLRKSSYPRYLTKLTEKYGLKEHIEFLGDLSAEEMKAAYLSANVFVLPSTSENSPNSLGEAMLLGVPCVASMVGGVSTMMEHNNEGFLYQSTAPYMLAHYIKKVFAMGENAAELGKAARQHALKTHDPETNLNCLLEIYKEVAVKN